MIFSGESRFREVEQEAFARSAAAYALFKEIDILAVFRRLHRALADGNYAVELYKLHGFAGIHKLFICERAG